MIFITHNASATMPTNAPASAVSTNVRVTLVSRTSAVCAVQAVQLPGFHVTAGPARVI